MAVIVLTNYQLSLEETSKNMAKYLNENHNQSIELKSLLAKIQDILVVENGILKVISAEKNQEYIDLNNFFNLFYGASVNEIIMLSNKFKSNVTTHSDPSLKTTRNLQKELEISLETIDELRAAYITLKRQTGKS